MQRPMFLDFKSLRHLIILIAFSLGGAAYGRGCDNLSAFLNLALDKQKSAAEALELVTTMHQLKNADELRIYENGEEIAVTIQGYGDGKLIYRRADQEQNLFREMDNDLRDFFRIAGEGEVRPPDVSSVSPSMASVVGTSDGVNLPAIIPDQSRAVVRFEPGAGARLETPDLPGTAPRIDDAISRPVVRVDPVAPSGFGRVESGTDIVDLARPRPDQLPSLSREAPVGPGRIEVSDDVPRLVAPDSIPRLAAPDIGNTSPSLGRVDIPSDAPLALPAPDAVRRITGPERPRLLEPPRRGDTPPRVDVDVEGTSFVGDLPSGTSPSLGRVDIPSDAPLALPAPDAVRRIAAPEQPRLLEPPTRADTLPSVDDAPTGTAVVKYEEGAVVNELAPGTSIVDDAVPETLIVNDVVPGGTSIVDDGLEGTRIADGASPRPTEGALTLRSGTDVEAVGPDGRAVATSGRDVEPYVYNGEVLDPENLPIPSPTRARIAADAIEGEYRVIDDFELFTESDAIVTFNRADNLEPYRGPFRAQTLSGQAIPDDEILEVLSAGARIRRAGSDFIEFISRNGKSFKLPTRFLRGRNLRLGLRGKQVLLNLPEALRRVGRTRLYEGSGEDEELVSPDVESPVVETIDPTLSATPEDTAVAPGEDDPPGEFNDGPPGTDTTETTEEEPELRIPLPAAGRGRPVGPQMKNMNKLQIIRTRGVR
jgi:hypothetical protein